MRSTWLLLRSHAAVPFLAAAAVATGTGAALGPDSRAVITRDGALGEPLPFVLALSGVAALVCLVEPSKELAATVPRSQIGIRARVAGFVLAVCTAATACSALVAPALLPATVRNVCLALAVTFLVALWQPVLAWVPTSTYLALSWFYGTATYDDAARAWAVPAHPPEWRTAGLWALAAVGAAVLWVLRPQAARSGPGTSARASSGGDGYRPAMTHPDPGGTPEAEAGSLTRTPTTPEQSAAGEVEPQKVTPGSYESDDAERERGKQVKPGGQARRG